jgi:hypothetical protein
MRQNSKRILSTRPFFWGWAIPIPIAILKKMNTADSDTVPILTDKNFGIGTIFMEDDAPFCLLSDTQFRNVFKEWFGRQKYKTLPIMFCIKYVYFNS